MTHITRNSRASDDRLLGWLALRMDHSARAAARMTRANAGRLIADTRAVAEADASESGEDVRAAYPWWRADA